MLHGSRLFIQCDNEAKSFLVALDTRTGQELWRTARDETSTWATPYVWRTPKRTEIVTAGSRKVRSYDPATGKLIWELGIQGRCAASPVGDADMLYVGAGGGGGGGGSSPLFAVRSGASGDLTLSTGRAGNAGVAWSTHRGGPPMASPLLYWGYLYVLEQRGGLVACLDAKSGKEAYRERLPGASGFTASPWGYGGRVFCMDETGRTFALQPGPKFKVLAENALDEMFWASPAMAGGALFLRGAEHLYCIKSGRAAR